MLIKMIAVLKFAFVAVCLVEVSSGFQWTSTDAVPNNSTIPACAGQNVTILWDFTKSSDDNIMEVEWRYQPNESSPEVVLATAVNGHFFSDAVGLVHLQYIPNAGIRLMGIAADNSGTYSVRVHINLHGSFITQVQSVNVVVTAAPITTGNHMYAHLQGAMFVNSTQQHHLILTCGDFSPVWIPSVDIVWTTPMNRTVPSTFRNNGLFALAVPNPFISGEYTCRIATSAAVTACISSESHLLRGATVVVDGVEGRVSLMDSEMKMMAAKIQTLETEEATMSREIHTLQMEKAQMTSEIHTLQTAKEQTDREINRLLAQVQTLQPDHINKINSTIRYLLGTGIRLVGGSSSSGRVEISLNGVWGTVCDDSWDNNDARVVCRQLGLSTSNSVGLQGNHNFGQGSGPIYRDNVQCVGNEAGLQDCPGSPVGKHNCGHNEDAGVTCSCMFCAKATSFK